MKLQIKKAILIFFSRPGENWQSGNIAIGNTEAVVNFIKDEYEIYTFKIEPLSAYPVNYNQMLDVCSQEQCSNARPEFKGAIPNLDQYETVIFGYPIWNSKLPNIYLTFLESIKLENKNLILFSTHGGSGLGSTQSMINKLHPNNKVVSTFSIDGSTVRSSAAKTKVLNWFKTLNLK